MAKRPQNGDIHNHFDYEIRTDSAQQLKKVLFFVAQGSQPHRKWLSGSRVAKSTTTPAAKSSHFGAAAQEGDVFLAQMAKWPQNGDIHNHSGL